MFNENFNLITPDNRYIFVNFLGGSKPPPYNVVVCNNLYSILNLHCIHFCFKGNAIIAFSKLRIVVKFKSAFFHYIT